MIFIFFNFIKIYLVQAFGMKGF